MGPSVDKHLWKTHHVPLHGSNPYQFWFTVDMADSAERKEYWLLDTLSNFKVASHHKSPVTGIVLVKFVVRYKSWLLPRKSNKSMRYAVLCGKISLWTYFATQWDDLATGRSMPSVPHCSFMAAIWPLIKGWAWRNHDGATRLLGLALSKTDWLLRQRARACLILPEDPCIVTLHPHEIGPNSPRFTFLERASSSSWWHSIFGSRYHNKLCLVTIMDSPASFSTCSASARSAITSHGPPNRLVYAGSHNGGEIFRREETNVSCDGAPPCPGHHIFPTTSVFKPIPSLCSLVPKCLNQLHVLTLHPYTSQSTSLISYSWL